MISHNTAALRTQVSFVNIFFASNTTADILLLGDLILSPSVPSRETALSWSHGSELIDSYLLSHSLQVAVTWLLRMLSFTPDLDGRLLKRLASLDYRKSLCNRMSLIYPRGEISSSPFLGCRRLERSRQHAHLGFIPPSYFDDFDVKQFYQVLSLLRA